MTPREIIAQSLFDFSGSGQGVDDMLEAIALSQSHAIFKDLKTAGYSIIHDSENHGPTVARAAEIIMCGCPDEHCMFIGNCAKDDARDIRAMTTGGRDAALPDEERE